MSDLTSLVAAHRVLVCVGSGGVGKTTTAASLALWGAIQGRRTAVVTIDPAKRLAHCLGLNALSPREEPLSAEMFAQYGLEPSGTLTALLVDQQSAWDAAVARYVPTPEVRDRILANRFYQGLSRTFAGSHEYMALDTLATLAQHGVYDLIVVDTPPSRQALDFLEAPQRVQQFLDSRASAWIIRSAMARSWAAISGVNKTTTFFLRKIEEATGMSALGEIAEFFSTMRHMFEDFGERFPRVSALLASDQTAFVLVTSPEEEVLTEAETFCAGLTRLSMTLKGVVVNRVHEEWKGKNAQAQNATELVERLGKAFHPSSKEESDLEGIAENFLAYQTLTRGEHLRLTRFRSTVSASIPFLHIPIVPAFPADLGGLRLLHRYLFSDRLAKQPQRAERAPKRTR